MIKFLLLTLIVLVIVLGIMCGPYIIRNIRGLCNLRIGKMLDLNLTDEDMDADYVEKLLSEDGPNSKLNLASSKELKKMIKYMRKNNLKIVPGKYEIWQGSDYNQLITSFKFYTDSNTEDTK